MVARPANSAGGIPTASTVMPSGRNLSEEIFFRSGKTARAVASAFRWTRPGAGGLPFAPEDFIKTEVVDTLKHGNFNDDQLYLDQRVSTATGVNPFTRIGRITESKLRDFITLYDQSDWYYNGQVNYQFDPRRGGTFEAPATSKESENYGETSPAPLSDVPTATTNPDRPRTVGAGFIIDEDEDEGKLTVVFRDGTYYNYYDVKLTTWEAFKASPSKGQFIRASLDSHRRGPATDVNLDPDIRQELYRILRTSQQVAKGRVATKRQQATKTMAASPKHANPTPKNSYRLNRARSRRTR